MPGVALTPNPFLTALKARLSKAIALMSLVSLYALSQLVNVQPQLQSAIQLLLLTTFGSQEFRRANAPPAPKW